MKFKGNTNRELVSRLIDDDTLFHLVCDGVNKCALCKLSKIGVCDEDGLDMDKFREWLDSDIDLTFEDGIMYTINELIKTGDESKPEQLEIIFKTASLLQEKLLNSQESDFDDDYELTDIQILDDI